MPPPLARALSAATRSTACPTAPRSSGRRSTSETPARMARSRVSGSSRSVERKIATSGWSSLYCATAPSVSSTGAASSSTRMVGRVWCARAMPARRSARSPAICTFGQRLERGLERGALELVAMDQDDGDGRGHAFLPWTAADLTAPGPRRTARCGVGRRTDRARTYFFSGLSVGRAGGRTSRLDDLGRHVTISSLLRGLVALVGEQGPEQRDVPEDRHLAHQLVRSRVLEAADDQVLAGVERHRRSRPCGC